MPIVFFCNKKVKSVVQVIIPVAIILTALDMAIVRINEREYS